MIWSRVLNLSTEVGNLISFGINILRLKIDNLMIGVGILRFKVDY